MAFASTKRALDSHGRPSSHLHVASDTIFTILKLAFLYFFFVFGAGCILGPMRMLGLVPRVGVRNAELIEVPVMLCVIFFAARRITQIRVRAGFSHWLAVGSTAFVFMIGAELALAGALWGRGIKEYFASRDPISGSVYYAELVLFAFLPFLFAKRRNSFRQSEN